MEIIQHLDVAVEFERSALSLRLLHANAGEVILELIVDEILQEGLADELRKLFL